MDTTEEGKLLKSKKKQEFRSLAELFQKYKIDQYFWRNYRDLPRFRSTVSIFLVAALSVVLAIIFCIFVLPSK